MSRTTSTAQNLLKATVSASRLARDISDSCPPACAAASILLLIFETIQSMKTNQAECYRLAQRCLDLLTEIQLQMGDQWDTAPASLVKNLRKFESTLDSIHKSLIEETQNKWHSRILRKAAISGALTDYNAELDDAARSFQIFTVLNIHYTVGRASGSSVLDERTPDAQVLQTSNLLYTDEPEDVSEASFSVLEDTSLNQEEQDISIVTDHDTVLSQPHAIVTQPENDWVYDSSSETESVPSAQSPSPTAENSEYDLLDKPAYRVFHQADITLKGRSRIKDGWLSGAVEIQLSKTQPALLKRYEASPNDDSAQNSWTRDVGILRNIQHTNLPHLLGISAPGTPTPFVVMGDVDTIPLRAYIRNLLVDSGVATCVQKILRFYTDVMDVTAYLRTELQLSDAKLQDYVESTSYRVDPSGRIIVGLPPSDVDDTIAVRSWSLSDSVRNVILQYVPSYEDDNTRVTGSEDDAELREQSKHIALLSALLSTPLKPDALPSCIQEILALPHPVELAQIRGIAMKHPYVKLSMYVGSK